VQHRLRWFGHIKQRPPEAPVRSRVISRAGNGKKLDMGGVREEKFEGLEYHQGVSIPISVSVKQKIVRRFHYIIRN
jgi:hypothetical protein